MTIAQSPSTLKSTTVKVSKQSTTLLKRKHAVLNADLDEEEEEDDDDLVIEEDDDDDDLDLEMDDMDLTKPLTTFDDDEEDDDDDF